jgi:hypothetical protein
MKTIIVTIAAALLSLNAAAYNPGIDPDEYCVTKKNGKTIVEYKGKAITKDVTLADGSKIKSNGTIVSASGERVKLKDGECINENNISDVIKSHKGDEGLFDREKGTGKDESDMNRDKKNEGEDNWDKSKDFDRSDSEKDMDNKHPDRNKDMDVSDPEYNQNQNKGSNKDFDMKHPENKDSLKLKKSYK